MPAAAPKKKWTSAPADEPGAQALVTSVGVSPIIARALVARGISDPEEARRFLSPDLERDWRDPHLLPGMDACADRVAAAVSAGERIVVFGDYDADGITAAALLSLGLREMGAGVDVVLPRRFDEGYGLTAGAVDRLVGMMPALVVTVDCGISSASEVAALAGAGVDVVVTDHHDVCEEVPAGVPVADPKLDGYPFEGLSGAGVALKLLQAVGQRVGQPRVWLGYTDLAAIGTIADVVPLLDENRSLVAHGLDRMSSSPRPGIAAVAAACDARKSAWTSERVAYVLAPRLNAAGRVGDPDEALELLCTRDPGRASTLASELDGRNKTRQSVEQDLLADAGRQADRLFQPGDRALVLSGEGWHEGVRGIVAGRIASAYGVPTLVFCIQDGVASGSGRSVGDVDLNAAVTSCAHVVTRSGGHSAAVGVTVPAERLTEFARSLRAALAELPAGLFEPRLVIDAEVALPEVDRELAAEIAVLEPFGHGNPKPLLCSRGVFMHARKRVGADGSHLKFEAYDGLASIPAIAFRQADDAGAAGGTDTSVDLAFHVEADEWQGRERVQLVVKDVAPHDEPPDGPASQLIEELFADAERILARGEYEGIGDAESFHTKLAGVTFEGRQDVVARLVPGTPLRLERQPGNAYDSNACALHDPAGDQVGFFNRRLAAALAPVIDGGIAYDVTVTEVTGGADGASLGVNVLVERRADAEFETDEAESAERRAELSSLPPARLEEELIRHFIGDRPLHDAQRSSLDHLAAGRGCLTVMATGRGKSLIFQLHAAMQALTRGRASIFVYPLRALVADQAFHLDEAYGSLGLRARLVTGESSPTDRDAVFAALADGAVDVLMTTPEFLERHAGRFASTGRVGFVVIDEAHHIALARAGHRPAYARLGAALTTLGSPTTLAVTATADLAAATAIRETLAVRETVLDPSVRGNLRLADRRGMGDKVSHLASLAARGGKMIVYVNSREQSVNIARKLRGTTPALRHAVAFYNGGVARAARHAIERAFRAGDVSVVVATSAFGEGINVPDVRDVALFHMPFNRVEFNQMCGRAGRDGDEASVHLLFGERDARVNEIVLSASAPALDDLRALYSALRDRSASGDGSSEVTNAELAEDVKVRRPKTRLSDRGVSTGIGIFREIGLVASEGAGGYRRLELLEAPQGKIDIPAMSVRYAEGLEEAAEFDEFRAWVLSASPDELLATFNRPILPQ